MASNPYEFIISLGPYVSNVAARKLLLNMWVPSQETLFSEFPTRSGTNQAVQLQKLTKRA